jgi:ribonuclease-3
MIDELQQKLGFQFNNTSLLEIALTHRSYLNEYSGEKNLEHNERLEFLGDAVLELIVTKFLFDKYPTHKEGDLTSFRAALVRTESLAQASRELEYGNYLKMSKGESDSGGRDKDYILANTFEAVLGAIYIDQGYSRCEELVKKILLPKVDSIIENRSDIDSKTKIQELSQSLYKLTPEYEIVSEEGPDHDKSFTSVIKIGERILGTGYGPSKQKAEEDAAKNGLEILEKES